MRSPILLVVLSAAVLGGCTSAYKTGQTPDDVYFSPARQHDEYVKLHDDNNDRMYQGDDYYDDRYLHMKVHNRVMWSDLDDYNFYNPRYSYSYYNSLNWNNPWSPYTYWNYYYNPYCSQQIVYTGYSKVVYNHPRIFNLNTYNNNQLTNSNYTNPKGVSYGNSNYGNYNHNGSRIIGSYQPANTNSNSGAGNFLRNIFNGSGNNNSSSNNSTSPSRSSSTSTSSGSNSGSSGGSAPVRRF